MSTITVVAKLVAKKDSIAAVKTELLKLVAPTRKEKGCIEYRLHQDIADPAVFVFYENWENATCLEKHLCTVHYKAYVSAVDGIIEGKTVSKMIQIA